MQISTNSPRKPQKWLLVYFLLSAVYLILVRVMALEIIKLYLPVNRSGSMNLKDDNTIAKSPLSRQEGQLGAMKSCVWKRNPEE